jgi:hypothetical protein
MMVRIAALLLICLQEVVSIAKFANPHFDFAKTLASGDALPPNRGKRCPTTPLQDPDLAARFDISSFLGLYYELALHDYTQPKICGCQTSNKTLASSTKLDDDFVLVCPDPSIQPNGKPYPSALSFNLTDEPGVFEGFWPLVPDQVFPDTVVAVGWPDDDASSPLYRWAIEFQCVEKDERIAFVGVNFYSRATRDDPEGVRAEEEMEAAAAEFGVYDYTGGPEGFRAVNHTGCPNV